MLHPKLYFADLDVQAWYACVTMTVLYYGVSYAVVRAALYWLGYPQADASAAFSSKTTGAFVALCILPPLAVYFVLNRIFVLRYYRPQPLTVSERQHFRPVHATLKVLRYWVSPITFKDVQRAYLHRVYGLVMAVVAEAMCLAALSRHYFLVPWINNSLFVSEGMQCAFNFYNLSILPSFFWCV